ncbi:hypothetical protein Q7C_1555 [Methylophaga frappieri]|jgi:hypothetical protein|uniref:YARHG domain-containing protein n=1 Tax=Methylophaga frappieri (strain ATCC BAA-2434 / DSM 25690 / JAM7) TaxID=754477 RepID=I1YIG1_METFJ|nr:hypothetical protein [Methylophaga frappieri]AFJ02704.1 hypothetical protein Q7C_1555 [Methylophaga frappieri]
MRYQFKPLRLRQKILFMLLCLMQFSGIALANPLKERNLPDGKLLYSDGTNAYYGVYMTSDYNALNGLDASDKKANFRVIAFRKAAPDGTLVSFLPQQIKDYNGNPIEGKRYGQNEIDLVNQHIIGPVDEKFPERREKNYLRILVYSKGEYFSGSPLSTQSPNPDLEEPEQWITGLNFERKNQRSPMRPAYEALGKTGVPKIHYAKGTQDTKRKKLPSTIASLRSKRQAEIAITKPEINPALGKQVVKDQEFWDRLQFSGTVKDVFEGNFSDTSSKTFKVYFSAMQWAYSDSCKPYLPANTVKRGYVTWNVYSDGYKDTPVERSALIDPKFIELYDAYQDDVSSFMQQQKRTLQSQANTSISRGRGLSDVLGGAINNEPIHQLSRFIASSGGCETSAVYQLRENFLRAAKGQPSLQKAGIVLENAVAESSKSKSSLYGSCMNTYDPSKKYCLCFEREALKVLSSKERQLFEADFDEYYKAVRKLSERPAPPASDRAWALNAIRSKCN